MSQPAIQCLVALAVLLPVILTVELAYMLLMILFGRT